MSRKQSGKAVRGNRKCEQERRRDERAARRALAKERRNRPAGGDEGEEFLSFSKQLQALGLRLREVPGDGNCLFRALADQLEGHSRGHERLRQEAVQHMAAHRQDFEPFVEDNVPFAQHLSNLSRSGTFAGNDAIVALARSQQLRVVIHQLDTPLWQISGTEKPRCRELHIAYRYGDHYDSVRKIGDNSEDAAHLRIENLEKCRSFGDEREEPPGASSSPSEDEELILSQCPAPPTLGQLGSGGCPELQAQRDSQAPPSHSEDQCAALPAEGGASQRVKARGKKKKDLQRLEKKKRQEERHKQKVSQGKDSPDQNQNQNQKPPDTVTLVPALSALSI